MKFLRFLSAPVLCMDNAGTVGAAPGAPRTMSVSADLSDPASAAAVAALQARNAPANVPAPGSASWSAPSHSPAQHAAGPQTVVINGQTYVAQAPHPQQFANPAVFAPQHMTVPTGHAEERAELAALTPDMKARLHKALQDADALTAAAHQLAPHQHSAANSDGSVTATIESLQRQIADNGRVLAKLNEDIVRRNGVSGAEDLARSDNPDKRFNVGRFVAGMLLGWRGPAAKWHERELSKQWSQDRGFGDSFGQVGWDLPHDTSSTSGLAGLIPPQFQAEFIERLSANVVGFRLGARYMPGLTGSPVEWFRKNGGAQAFWTAENLPVQTSQVSLDALRLTPKELASATELTQRLADLAGPGAQMLVEEDMARVHGEAIDLAMLRGGGGSGTPLGILNTPGVGETDFSSVTGTPIPNTGTGIEFGSDTVLQNVTDYLNYMNARIDQRNAMPGGGNKVGFACNPMLPMKLRSAKDINGQPVLHMTMEGQQRRDADASGTGLGELWGRALATSSNLVYGTGTEFLLGVWDQYIVGAWGAIRVNVYDQHANFALLRRLLVVMTQYLDGGARHPEAFEKATNFDL